MAKFCKISSLASMVALSELLSMEFGKIIAQRAFGFRIWVSLSIKTFSISLALGLRCSNTL